jgi:retron-type reverse transcriptase
VAATSIDLSRAFDSVDHGILLSKLHWYGIDPTWFRSYLGDRRQLVRGGCLSLPLSHGVPQGSLVGPILFSIFTNDLPSYIPHGRLVSYADDTQLLDSARPNDQSILKKTSGRDNPCRPVVFRFKFAQDEPNQNHPTPCWNN